MRTRAVLAILFLFSNLTSALAQGLGTLAQPGANTTSGATTDVPRIDIPQTQQPSLDNFNGSGIVDKLVPGVVRISLLDALDRGIKHNLGLLLSQEQTETARAQHLRSLALLLPDVSGRTSENVQRINLAAFGIPVSANSPTLVGPFSVFDARATVRQSLLDFNALNRLRSAAESERAARLSLQDARELVVLVVGNEYLLTLADAARYDTAKAQLTTAETILHRTQDMKASGMVAGLDVLRAQVQMQAQQQRVLAAENQLLRQRMVLARTIGLPVSQQFELTDTVPVSPTPPLDLDTELALAYERRPEYLAAQSRVRAAELTLKAARDERLPSLEINGDYGVIGRAPGDAKQTYSLAGGVRIPIFQGGRTRADIAQAQADLRQRKFQLGSCGTAAHADAGPFYRRCFRDARRRPGAGGGSYSK